MKFNITHDNTTSKIRGGDYMKGTYRYDKKAQRYYVSIYWQGMVNLIGYFAITENLSGTKRLPINY